MLKVTSPFDGSLIAEIPYAKPSEVDGVIAAAHSMQELWRQVSVANRKSLVADGLAVFRSNKTEIAREISQQMGKPLAQALGEVDALVERGEYMLSIAEEALAPVVLPEKEGFTRRIEHAPVGVVFHISAWNYPLVIPINVIVPALLAGNTVVLKHSPLTPLTGYWFTKAFGGKGLVADLVMDHETAGGVIDDSRIAHVSFTGSVAGGRAVAERAGKTGTSVSLELGGADPAYVTVDADLDYAVSGIVDGACYNAGQSCCAVERVYVHETHFDSFVEKATAELGNYRVGDPFGDGINMGPLAQRAGVREVEAQLADASARGASVQRLGTIVNEQGNICRPAIVVGAPEDSLVMREETFGPVVPVARVASDEEAIKKMNESRYGLTASVWTASDQQAEKLAMQLDSGTVFQNRCDFLDPALPWTGVRDSGYGSSLSEFGFVGLTRRKSIHFRTRTK